MLLHMIIELIHLGIMKSLDIMSRSKSHIVHGNSRGKTLQISQAARKGFNVIMLMTTYIIITSTKLQLSGPNTQLVTHFEPK